MMTSNLLKAPSGELFFSLSLTPERGKASSYISINHWCSEGNHPHMYRVRLVDGHNFQWGLSYWNLHHFPSPRSLYCPLLKHFPQYKTCTFQLSCQSREKTVSPVSRTSIGITVFSTVEKARMPINTGFLMPLPRAKMSILIPLCSLLPISHPAVFPRNQNPRYCTHSNVPQTQKYQGFQASYPIKLLHQNSL